MRRVPWVFVAALFAFSAAAVAQAGSASAAPQTAGPQAYPGAVGQTVTCESSNGRGNRCRVPRQWDAARIVQQLSHSACTFGRTWGFDPGSVWVSNGCRARFAAAPRGGWQPGPGWNRDFVMSCGSPQYKYYFCKVDVGARGRVTLQRQVSSTRCVEGRTWGWNRAGIWVDKGCGAQFLVKRRF